MRTDAERETAQARHQAYGEAERIVADARSEVSNLKSSVAGLREERDAAETSMRELSERLQGALQAYAAPGRPVAVRGRAPPPVGAATRSTAPRR